MKLTKSAIEALAYDPGARRVTEAGKAIHRRHILWDDSLTGLGVRVYPSGKKVFVIWYRPDGRRHPRFMTIGHFGRDMTLDQARKVAKIRLAEVSQGRDPLDEKRRGRNGGTFGELCTSFIEDYAKKQKKTWSTDESRIKRHFPSSWKSRRADKITREDIADLHRDIGGDRPYEANRTRDLLRVMFEKAKAWGYLDRNADNPADGVTKYKERKRKRAVSNDELPMLIRAIDKEESIYIRGALWLYLLTGLRKVELLQVRWADIDMAGARLRLPDTKAGEPQFVPLSRAAVAIIQTLPAAEKNPHLIPSPKKPGAHLVNIDKPWRRIRKAAHLDDVRLHDLRRSVGSMMTANSVDLNVIKEGLRHANISTTLGYAVLGSDPARDAFEAHGERIFQVAGRLRPVAVND